MLRRSGGTMAAMMGNGAARGNRRSAGCGRRPASARGGAPCDRPSAGSRSGLPGSVVASGRRTMPGDVSGESIADADSRAGRDDVGGGARPGPGAHGGGARGRGDRGARAAPAAFDRRRDRGRDGARGRRADRCAWRSGRAAAAAALHRRALRRRFRGDDLGGPRDRRCARPRSRPRAHASRIRGAGTRQRASRSRAPRGALRRRKAGARAAPAAGRVPRPHAQDPGLAADRGIQERRLPRGPVRRLDRARGAPRPGARARAPRSGAEPGLALDRDPERRAHVRGGGRPARLLRVAGRRDRRRRPGDDRDAGLDPGGRGARGARSEGGGMSEGPLTGRGAVVTGGGRGIGAAIAKSLAEAGAEVVVAARTADEIDQVAGGIGESGARAWAVPCDVSDEDSVRRLGDAARRRLRSVDILVNSAGAGASGPLRKIALEDWNLVLSSNATATFLCSREFVPGMVERKWGRVVNIASIAGLEGAKYVSHYSAAKHAVIGFTRSVALEVAGSGVTVNAVCPAYVDTPMTEITIAAVESRKGLSRDEALAAVLATTGQARLIEPGEVARVVLQLCAQEADIMNGRSVVLNPGEAGVTPEVVNPSSLTKPRGFNHGILAPRKGRLLFVAGQPGWENDAAGTPPGFADQFARALDKILAVVAAADGKPTDVVRMTCFVTDLKAY